MSSVTASKAKAQLHNLIDEVAESRVPLRIVGKHNYQRTVDSLLLWVEPNNDYQISDIQDCQRNW